MQFRLIVSDVKRVEGDQINGKTQLCQ